MPLLIRELLICYIVEISEDSEVYDSGLDDEAIVKLLTGCPSLETMELTYFHGFQHLEIKNINLKTLKLHNFWQLYGGDH